MKDIEPASAVMSESNEFGSHLIGKSVNYRFAIIEFARAIPSTSTAQKLADDNIADQLYYNILLYLHIVYI